MTDKTTQLSDIAKALEYAYKQVSKHHDVLPIIFTVALDERNTKRGSYTYDKWTNHERTVDEVFINSNILAEGAESVMRTVLHEAVHSLARKREVQETSRDGRYHNKKFKELAEEVGLVVKKDEKVGYCTPGLTDEAKVVYAGAVEKIAKVLEFWQEPRPKGGSAGRQLKAVCGCGRILRGSRKVFDEGEIICGNCGEEFEVW